MLRRATAAAALVLVTATVPAIGLAGAEASGPPVTAGDTLYRPGAAVDADDGKARVTPRKYAAVEVDVAGVARTLRNAPVAGRSDARQTFRVPTPTGGFERFAVQRTQTMESQLAADHPEIGTWSGRSLDNPGTTIALDVTPMGFHASVRGADGQGAWLVDPAYDRRGTTTHLSYYAAAVDGTDADRFVERETRSIGNSLARGPVTPRRARRSSQRVYRLALITDPSYADYFGTENVLAEKVTLINRVNQIYNDDLAITMRLVNDTDKLNLDTTAKAPEPDGPVRGARVLRPGRPRQPGDLQPARLLRHRDAGPQPHRARPARRCLQLRRRAHRARRQRRRHRVPRRGRLGLQGQRVHRAAPAAGRLLRPRLRRARARPPVRRQPHLQRRAVRLLGGNREPATSVEPGSGSSVMAYAGICLQDDLQPHTDPYFSQRTNDEVNAYTDSPTLPVTEVQTVSLRGFDTDGEQVRLDFPGPSGPITLTRGSDYDAANLESEIETLTGRNVTISGWGYDPYGDPVELIAPLTAPDDTGFQVIFSGSPDPEVYGGAGDVASLEVDSPSAGRDRLRRRDRQGRRRRQRRPHRHDPQPHAEGQGAAEQDHPAADPVQADRVAAATRTATS